MVQTLQEFKDNMFKDNRIHTDKYYLFYADILAMKKERYITMFTKLDSVMMEAENQLSYLSNQFANTSN